MMVQSDIVGHAVRVDGRVARVVRLRDEYYDFVESPQAFVELASIGWTRENSIDDQTILCIRMTTGPFAGPSILTWICPQGPST